LAEVALNLISVQLNDFMEGTEFFTVPQFFSLQA